MPAPGRTGSVRDLPGVTDVGNRIGIKPKVPVETVKSDIEAALQQAPLLIGQTRLISGPAPDAARSRCGA